MFHVPAAGRFFLTATPTTQIYTLSLHDALPISLHYAAGAEQLSYLDIAPVEELAAPSLQARSEEHTSELQSRFDLVCRLLLEKKKSPWPCTCRRTRQAQPAGLPSSCG